MNRIANFQYIVIVLLLFSTHTLLANQTTDLLPSLPAFDTQIIDTTICIGDCLVFESLTYCEAGTYPIEGARTIKLAFTEKVRTTDYTICEGETYPDQDWDTTGQYFYQTAIDGCPITVWVNLSVMPHENTFINEVITYGECYDFGPNTLCQSGEYELKYSTVFGCDSTVYINLTVEELLLDTLPPISICPGETYKVPNIDTILTTTGLYQFYAENAAGRAMMTILDFQVESEIKVQVSERSCEGEAFEYNGDFLTTSGIYEYTFQAVNGCDSLVLLDLSVGTVTTTNIVDSIPSGESFAVGKNNVSFEGDYEFVFESIAGCDSMVFLSLSFMETENPIDGGNPTEIDPTDPEEESPVVPVDPSPEGTIGDSIILAQDFCDGLVRASLCYKELPYKLGDNTFWEGGIFNLRYLAPDSCSNDVFLELIVEKNRTYLTRTICAGANFPVGNSNYTETGEYIDTLQAASGCDSLVFLDLTVGLNKTKILEEQICWGEPYTINGNYITESGEYTEVYRTVLGCDSLVTIELTIEGGPNPDPQNLELCAGDWYADDIGNRVTVSGKYNFRFQTVAGCDSTVTIDLIIPDTVRTSIDTFFCEGGRYDLQYFAVTQAGTYRERLTTTAGCDSIIQYTLETLDCEINAVQDADTITCGGNTGEFSFLLIKGQAPFTYKWASEDQQFSGQGTDVNLQDTITHKNLPSGSYAITVTDRIGIQVILEVEIIRPDPITARWVMPALKGATYLACPGDQDAFLQILPAGGVPPYRYAWSTGATDTDRVDNLPKGQYTVTITDNFNCPYIDSQMLDEPPPLALQVIGSNPMCEDMATGKLEVVSMLGGTAPYQYRMGREGAYASKRTFANLIPGDYSIEVKDANNCPMDTSLNISEPAIIELVYESDILLELGDTYPLDILSSHEPQTINWMETPGLSCYDCLDAVANPIENTTYSLTVISEDDCETTIELKVVIDKERDIFIPNVFSPNADGLNDRFTIFSGPEVSQINYFHIYSRWGALLFETSNLPTNDEQLGWDGRFNGKKMIPGVYIWKAEVTYIDGLVENYTGDVLLLE